MEKLTSKHFIFFIIGITGSALLNYPSLFINFGGRDTWIFTIISSLIFLFFSIYIFLIIKKIKNYDFVSVCYFSLGKFFGRIFLVIFSTVLVLVCIEAASVSSSTIHANIFLDTPVWYSLIFFIISAFLISKNRFSSMLIIIVVSVSIIIVIELLIGIFTIHYVDLTALLPILYDKTIIDYTLCTLTQLGSLSSFFILLPLLGKIDDKININKYSLITLILLFIALVWFIVNIITTLGPYRSSNVFFPQYIQAQRISLGGFIENGELFIIITSILFSIIKYIITIFILYSLWKDKIKSKNLFIGIISFGIFIASYFISKNIYSMFSQLINYQILLMIVLLICPIIIYSIYWLKITMKKYLYK